MAAIERPVVAPQVPAIEEQVQAIEQQMALTVRKDTRQSKGQLVTEIGKIKAEVEVLKGVAEFAEAEWKPTDNTEAPKEYNRIGSSLRSGELSQLRGACFHLYRDHIVDSARFKDAENAYNKLITSVNKLSTSLLLASRGQLDQAQIRSIVPAIDTVSENLDAFLEIAG